MQHMPGKLLRYDSIAVDYYLISQYTTDGIEEYSYGSRARFLCLIVVAV
mgnify:CR=1 FL=1